jgi:hypothetical protein
MTEAADDDEQAARKRKWESASLRLFETIRALGLAYERDFVLHGEDWAEPGTGIEVRDESLITADFLVACHRALSDEGGWAALVVVPDPTRRNKMRSIVEISSGSFATIGGDTTRTRRVIFEACDKLGMGHLLWKRE